MKFKKSYVLAALLVLSSIRVSFGQTLIQRLDSSGSVDWERLIIRATGSSAIGTTNRNTSPRVQAVENAKLSAADNLLKALKLLNLDSNVRINDKLADDSDAALAGVADRFTIVDTRSMSDMTIELDVELPLTGQLAALFIPKDTGKSPLKLDRTPLCPCCGQPWPSGKTVPEGIKLIVPAEGYTTQKGTPFTSLVIDARDLGLTPALFPKIVNEANEELYGIGYVYRQVAIESGMVIYKKDLNEALKDSRSGSDPLVIRALKAAGTLKSDVVVSNYDGFLIHAAAKMQNFLAICRVLIVIG